MDKFLWIWKDFNGHEIWLWKNFVMFSHETFCGYALGYVGIYLCMGMNMWESFFFFFMTILGMWEKKFLIVHGYGKNLVVVHEYVNKNCLW